MALRLYTTAQLLYLLVRNIFPRTSSHDLLGHRTMRKYSHPIFRKLLVFHLSIKKPGFEHISCVFYYILANLTFSLSTTKKWSRNDVGSPKSKSIFHVGLHAQTRIILSLLTKKHSQFGTFTLPCTKKELSRITFPNLVQQTDDRTDFAQEERLDLPNWTMIWAIRALVNVSKYMNILTLELTVMVLRRSLQDSPSPSTPRRAQTNTTGSVSMSQKQLNRVTDTPSLAVQPPISWRT